ncbi:MAG: hypothetical protein F6K21_10300 [Symploca sp. SIO2D2]|nr:hypothetical protein [Symploca sp. SIO2D2]
MQVQEYDLKAQQAETKAQHINQMRTYVLSLTGVLILFAITFPVACWRVSQSEKYGGLPLKSLTTEDTQKPQSSYPD